MMALVLANNERCPPRLYYPTMSEWRGFEPLSTVAGGLSMSCCSDSSSTRDPEGPAIIGTASRSCASPSNLPRGWERRVSCGFRCGKPSRAIFRGRTPWRRGARAGCLSFYRRRGAHLPSIPAAADDAARGTALERGRLVLSENGGSCGGHAPPGRSDLMGKAKAEGGNRLYVRVLKSDSRLAMRASASLKCSKTSGVPRE